MSNIVENEIKIVEAILEWRKAKLKILNSHMKQRPEDSILISYYIKDVQLVKEGIKYLESLIIERILLDDRSIPLTDREVMILHSMVQCSVTSPSIVNIEEAKRLFDINNLRNELYLEYYKNCSKGWII